MRLVRRMVGRAGAVGTSVPESSGADSDTSDPCPVTPMPIWPGSGPAAGHPRPLGRAPRPGRCRGTPKGSGARTSAGRRRRRLLPGATMNRRRVGGRAGAVVTAWVGGDRSASGRHGGGTSWTEPAPRRCKRLRGRRHLAVTGLSAGVNASSVSVGAAGTMTATVTVPAGASPGSYLVTVTKPLPRLIDVRPLPESDRRPDVERHRPVQRPPSERHSSGHHLVRLRRQCRRDGPCRRHLVGKARRRRSQSPTIRLRPQRQRCQYAERISPHLPRTAYSRCPHVPPEPHSDLLGPFHQPHQICFTRVAFEAGRARRRGRWWSSVRLTGGGADGRPEDGIGT